MDYYVFENTNCFLCELEEIHGTQDMNCQHYHADYEILFMIEGERHAFINNGMQCLKRGDIVIFRPYVLHYTISKDSPYFKRYVLNFSKSMLSDLLTEKECDMLLTNFLTQRVHIEEENMPVLTKLFEDLADMKILESYEKKLLCAKLATLIDIISKSVVLSSTEENVTIACPDSFSDTINYINSNYTKDLTLDFVVDYAHMSKSHFCRVFRRETGNTFLQYLNNMRVAYAHNLLLGTDLSIQKIAEKAGFSSILHFDRVFKSIHNTTPSSIRRQKSN